MTLENRGNLEVHTAMDYDIIVILALSSIDCTQEQAMGKQDVRDSRDNLSESQSATVNMTSMCRCALVQMTSP